MQNLLTKPVIQTEVKLENYKATCRCEKCGRKLSDSRSILIGMGPTCYKKFKAELALKAHQEILPFIQEPSIKRENLEPIELPLTATREQIAVAIFQAPIIQKNNNVEILCGVSDVELELFYSSRPRPRTRKRA